MKYAECRGMDPELFYPGIGESAIQAKLVCRGCLVRIQCLHYGVKNSLGFGVWGGTSERQRIRIKKREKREKTG